MIKFGPSHPGTHESMNPLNYNPYTYVLNNPLKYTDPSGYWSTWAEIYDVINALWYTQYGGHQSSEDPHPTYYNNPEEAEASTGGSWTTQTSIKITTSGKLFTTLPKGVKYGKEHGDRIVWDDFSIDISIEETPVWVPDNNPVIDYSVGPWSNETLDEFYGTTDYSNPEINLNPTNPSPESHVGGGGGGGDNTLNKISEISKVVSITTSITHSTLATTRIGSNIAYQLSSNRVFMQTSRLIQPLGYLTLFYTIPYDLYKANAGQQSWSEAILNSTISTSAMLIGGWYGLGIVGMYSFGKVGYNATMNGLEQGIIKPNPNLTRNYIPGLAPTPVIY